MPDCAPGDSEQPRLERTAFGVIVESGHLFGHRNDRFLHDMIKVPSQMIAVNDAILELAILRGVKKPSGLLMSSWHDYHWLIVFDNPDHRKAREAIKRRHADRFNVAFCDGHVESLRTGMLFAKSKTVLRRWRYDNEPHMEAVHELVKAGKWED